MTVDEIAARDRGPEIEAWKARGGSRSPRELLEAPAPIAWHIYHQECDPAPEHEGYSLLASQCSTWPQLVAWTAHVLEKPWLQYTTWGSLLRTILTSSGESAAVGR
ncbi:hypothetical protein BA059_05010 [Mycolicibacterium sp. (ex Dasyatis americana)]|uniref:hypothetical protein n=1 Tax=Mycobacterium sp. DBP42 TaxID=2545267 RepID=UPI0008724BB4|nr:hypothetical protein [Mycobacterium sp. DBP42]OFB42571.1 hypothetical protein BA059_05010 [Mycolicibacterium sp. (ex Dasyatis americana)]TMS50384.1 hypothetical protein E0T84_24030 [Mycobacterium sp. DBP42]